MKRVNPLNYMSRLGNALFISELQRIAGRILASVPSADRESRARKTLRVHFATWNYRLLIANVTAVRAAVESLDRRSPRMVESAPMHAIADSCSQDEYVRLRAIPLNEA